MTGIKCIRIKTKLICPGFQTHRLSAGLIITQTPLPDTMIDFYRLLWDNHVVTVVMMDSDHENEKVSGLL